MIKVKENPLTPLLMAWQQAAIVDFDSFGVGGRHLSDDELYGLAVSGAISRAREQQVEHLSLCPVCQQKWAEWLRAVYLAGGLEEDRGNIHSFGLLEAAAGLKQQDAISSKSACGKFVLGVYPKKGLADQVMITLEYIGGEAADMEGRQFVVRERGGRVLLDGLLRNGRLARVYDSLDDIDLGQWTLAG